MKKLPYSTPEESGGIVSNHVLRSPVHGFTRDMRAGKRRSQTYTCVLEPSHCTGSLFLEMPRSTQTLRPRWLPIRGADSLQRFEIVSGASVGLCNFLIDGTTVASGVSVPQEIASPTVQIVSRHAQFNKRHVDIDQHDLRNYLKTRSARCNIRNTNTDPCVPAFQQP